MTKAGRNFSYKEGLEQIRTVLCSGIGVREGVMRLVDYCARIAPGEVWDVFRGLQFEEDVEQLTAWLGEVLSTEPPDEHIKAFWFGLFNPIAADGRATCGLYVSGSMEFDPDDTSGDWACWDDESYLPEGRYAKSNVLHTVYRMTEKTEWSRVGESVVCLGYAGLAVREICKRVPPDLLRGGRDSRAVVVGFDWGDFVLLGSIEADGWHDWGD